MVVVAVVVVLYYRSSGKGQGYGMVRGECGGEILQLKCLPVASRILSAFGGYGDEDDAEEDEDKRLADGRGRDHVCCIRWSSFFGGCVYVD